jgi:hypothetical protein
MRSIAFDLALVILIGLAIAAVLDSWMSPHSIERANHGMQRPVGVQWVFGQKRGAGGLLP